MKIAYPVVLTPVPGGGYSVEVPDIPECRTGGNDLAEALLMAQDAMGAWLLGLLERGQGIPAPTGIEGIQETFPNALVSMAAIDMDVYAEKNGRKVVRKNVTIPAYLDAMAAGRRINYSSLLRAALERELLELPSKRDLLRRKAAEVVPVGRIPFDASYVVALGKTVYQFAYLENTILSILYYVDPDYRTTYLTSSAMTSGQFANDLLAKIDSRRWAEVRCKDELRECFLKFKTLVSDKRNALIHAHPITMKDTDGHNTQILYYGGDAKSSVQNINWTQSVVEAFADEIHDLDMQTSDLYERIAAFYKDSGK